MAQAAVPAMIMMSAVTTAAQIDQSRQASKSQRKLQDANQRRQDEMLAEANDQKMAERKAITDAENQSSANAEKNASRSKQKAMAGAYAGRSGTILTNGATLNEEEDDETLTSKTLLGA